MIRTAVPNNSFATPDVLDIVIKMRFSTQCENHVLCTEVLLNNCTNRYTMSIIQHQSSRPPRFTKDWLVSLEFGLHSNPYLINELPRTHVSRNCQALFHKASEYDPKYLLRDEHRPPIQALVLNAIRLKYQLRKLWQNTRDPL
jgi:hypothetical protein